MKLVLPPYRPQLATLARVPPSDDDLTVGGELKHDGWRAGAILRPGKPPRLESRHNNDLSARFPTLITALARLPVENAMLDGEIAVLMPDGRTDFQALQHGTHGIGLLVYYAFDVVHHDGDDVARLPYVDRKARLAKLLAGEAAHGVIRYTSHIIGNSARMLAGACELGAEGIVCKRLDAPYRPGRSRDWLKYKCLRTEPFVLGGFTAGATRVSSLLVGYHDAAGALRYAGSVSTGKGFTHEFLRGLYGRLVHIEQPRSPFEGFEPSFVRSPWSKGRESPARWVKPVAVVSVSYLELARAGQLRHASFQGFQRDVVARDVVRK